MPTSVPVRDTVFFANFSLKIIFGNSQKFLLCFCHAIYEFLLCDNAWILFQNMFCNILNRFWREKNFSTKIFWLCHFFTILAEKRQSPTTKNLHVKNFRFRDFHFKIRFKTFWIDSDQKNFWPNFFDLVIFLKWAKPYLPLSSSLHYHLYSLVPRLKNEYLLN